MPLDHRQAGHLRILQRGINHQATLHHDYLRPLVAAKVFSPLDLEEHARGVYSDMEEGLDHVGGRRQKVPSGRSRQQLRLTSCR